MKLILSTWALHLMLVPIYVFGSGSMQPSHMMLLLALSLFFLKPDNHRDAAISSTPAELNRQIAARGRLICTLFALFALYVCMVNSTWSMLLSSSKPLLFSSFQVYNLLLIYFIFSVASRDFYRFARYTRWGFSGAISIILLSILYSGVGSVARESGLFNNPNQLAFFCLSSCLAFYIMEKLSIGSSLWNRALIGLSCFICILTLSRAGLVGCGLIFIASLFDGARKMSRGLTIVIVGGILVIFAGSIDVLDKLEARNKQTNAVFDNQFEGRGYDRIVGNPEYILFGAGEGENRRFDGFLASIGGEMHSSVGTLLFSYGVLGLALYSSLWAIMLFSYSGMAFKICAAAPIIYSFTHNGLRFSAALIAIMLMICGGMAARYGNQRIAKTYQV